MRKMVLSAYSTQIPLAKVMAFVDGGYLREQCSNIFDEEINFQKLKERIISKFNANVNGKYDGDLVRIYYYDGIVDTENPKFKEQTNYFERIKRVIKELWKLFETTEDDKLKVKILKTIADNRKTHANLLERSDLMHLGNTLHQELSPDKGGMVFDDTFAPKRQEIDYDKIVN